MKAFKTFLAVAMFIPLFAFVAFAADKGGPVTPLPPETASEEPSPPLSVGCWGGVSAGKTITSNAFDVGPAGRIVVSADGLQAGLEAGCDMFLRRVLVGVMGRFEFLDQNERTAIGNFGTDTQWMIALRSGVYINPGVLAYGLVGYQKADLAFPGSNNETEGIVWGGGLEMGFMDPAFTLFVEWTRVDFDNVLVSGTDVAPATDTIRVGARYRFNMFK